MKNNPNVRHINKNLVHVFPKFLSPKELKDICVYLFNIGFYYKPPYLSANPEIMIFYK